MLLERPADRAHAKLTSKDWDEPSLLAAFDRNRDRILAIARTVYKGGPQNRYTVS
ncbi:DUF1488 family protein [Paraburkholderia sp. LEh10]|uniref:DUF1488 family protein n=1 Tax=Paraburkholderia sp. LEh10 TaxID=2821353 RepID=UPI001AE62511|nr:DUF1488 family protein [Paraburkholderia sp. LEh10]MBP0594259.1 DUF1488 family protein [Paraburkholderia sp. LEh10]